MDEATKIKKLKEQEGAPEGGGCRIFVILFGLAVMAAGFYVIFFVEGKPSALATVSETSLFVSETAVSTSATPTLKPTATATASATARPTETATAVPTATAQATHTPLPTQTPYPTYTPYPSATWTPQATFTPQPTYTPYPTATPSATASPPPVATERPFLAPIFPEADPPGGNYPTWLPWLIGGLFTLALTALGVLAYVSRQMRPPAPAPAASMPPGGGGQTLPPPDWPPVREPRPAPVRAPVTPVSPPGELPEVAPVQTAAPPEKIEVSVTDANASTDEATMKAICTAWNEIKARGERPSLNKVCQEYFGGKNSERMAIARRALKWGRAHGHIQTQQTQTQSEVNHVPANHPKPEPKTPNRRPRRPITISGRKGTYRLN